MKPNVVVILTDDQPKQLLDAMPTVRSEIRDKGINLTYGFAPSPVCAIARTSLLANAYAHDMNLWSNTTEEGGWRQFQKYEDKTLATALHDQGYHTGLVGKYLNGWSSFSGKVPPGWDTFRAVTPDDGGDGAYYNYVVQGTGEKLHYGDNPEDYSTDVLGAEACDFIELAPEDKPLFLYFAPYGAHAAFIPAPRHKDTWPLPKNLHPAVNSSNRDKSPWLRDLEKMDEDELKNLVKSQHEVLKSVDEVIRDIIYTLAFYNRKDTLFVFAGDNGLQRGEHRLNGKYVPYQASTHLQMLVRWDGKYDSGKPHSRVTILQDLTATIVEAAGAILPGCGFPLDENRAGTLLEGGWNHERPPYIGWRTRNFMYCKFADGGEEFYDYTLDPFELTNQINNPQYEAKIMEFRDKAREACRPRPPEWKD